MSDVLAGHAVGPLIGSLVQLAICLVAVVIVIRSRSKNRP